MWTRQELKTNAKKIMSKHYWKMVLVTFVCALLSGEIFTFIYEFNQDFSNPYNGYNVALPDTQLSNEAMMLLLEIAGLVIAGSLILGSINFIYNLFIGNLLVIGNAKYFLNARDDKGSVNDLFFSFRHNYFNAVKILFLQSVKIFLWSLLFLIPGIIKTYEYLMIPYLLAEDPSMSSSKAFELTKELTRDQKWNMFVLELSFLGWMILGIIACGIGIYFVVPYIEATFAELYVKLKEIKHIDVGNSIPPIPDF